MYIIDATLSFQPSTPFISFPIAMNSSSTTLHATDGHSLSAHVARPAGTPKGYIVVVQEIFGVNSHVRSVADRYAQAGYVAIAPALFDRVQRGYESGYSQPEVAAGVELMKQLSFDNALLDVQAALAARPADLAVGIVGYCYGGTVAWLAARRQQGLAAAACYYGGGIPGFIDERPACPTMLHFGIQDQSLPVEKAQEVAQRHPQVASFFYEAGHGFNCEQRSSYDEAAAAQAQERTLAFFGQHLSRPA